MVFSLYSVRKTTQQGFSPDGEDFVVRCFQCDLSSLSLESDDESMAYIAVWYPFCLVWSSISFFRPENVSYK